jgi:hypothetical protein
LSERYEDKQKVGGVTYKLALQVLEIGGDYYIQLDVSLDIDISAEVQAAQ